MNQQGEIRSHLYTAKRYHLRPELCYTVASYNSNDDGDFTDYDDQIAAIKDKLITIRLTGARLWIMVELLSALHSDELMPCGQTSNLDKNWKKAWLSEVQNPCVAMITYLNRSADAGMTQSFQAISEQIRHARKEDCERLTNAIRDVLRIKMASTPECPDRDKVMAIRLVRTLLLIMGELCGDLGEDFKIPVAFTGENSLLMRDAEISHDSRRKNMHLTTDFKENLLQMQVHMANKADELYGEEQMLYDQQFENKSLAEWCDEDAAEVESKIFLPFADECNSWDLTCTCA